MLTRCPHCGATFRVTEAHLNAAHGKVRCGACMEIFNATEHLLQTPEPSLPTKPETRPIKPERKEPVFSDEPASAKTSPKTSAIASATAASAGLAATAQAGGLDEDELDQALDFVSREVTPRADKPSFEGELSEHENDRKSEASQRAAKDEIDEELAEEFDEDDLDAEIHQSLLQDEMLVEATQEAEAEDLDAELEAILNSTDEDLDDDLSDINLDDELDAAEAEDMAQSPHPGATKSPLKTASKPRVLDEDNLRFDDETGLDDEDESEEILQDALRPQKPVPPPPTSQEDLEELAALIGDDEDFLEAEEAEEVAVSMTAPPEDESYLSDDEYGLAESDEDAALRAMEEEIRAVLGQPDVDESPRTTSEEDEPLFQDNPDEDRSAGGYHAGKQWKDEDLSDDFKNLNRKDSQASQFTEVLEETEEGEESQDESWAEQMLEELREDRRSIVPPEPIEAMPAPSLELSVEQEPEIRAEPITPRPASTFTYDRLRSEPIAVEADDEEAGGNFMRLLGWTIVNLVLLVALVGQLAWFHYDKLARYESLRNTYASICNMVGCTLPTLYDANLIKSRSLKVHSHPSAKNALVIEILMENQANFAQPFPAISFQFADQNNQVLAQRVFTPSEYLRGEVRGMYMMPPETPIRVSLEIIDPGADAVNYSMRFVPVQKAGG